MFPKNQMNKENDFKLKTALSAGEVEYTYWKSDGK